MTDENERLAAHRAKMREETERRMREYREDLAARLDDELQRRASEMDEDRKPQPESPNGTISMWRWQSVVEARLWQEDRARVRQHSEAVVAGLSEAIVAGAFPNLDPDAGPDDPGAVYAPTIIENEDHPFGDAVGWETERAREFFDGWDFTDDAGPEHEANLATLLRDTWAGGFSDGFDGLERVEALLRSWENGLPTGDQVGDVDASRLRLCIRELRTALGKDNEG